jgi:hypothetical protein
MNETEGSSPMMIHRQPCVSVQKDSATFLEDLAGKDKEDWEPLIGDESRHVMQSSRLGKLLRASCAA